MAKKPIEQMNYEELRAEVKLMSDDMARMKRTYEDLLYNLDMSNFSEQFVKEAEGVKSSITQTASEIRAEVQKSAETLDGKIKENASSISQTSEAIKSEVTERENADNELSTQIATVTQAAEGIKTEVATVKEDLKTNYSTTTQTATEIETKVSQAVDDMTGTMDGKLESYSTIEQTANHIKSIVYKEVSLASAILVESDADFTDIDKVYKIKTTVTVKGEGQSEEEYSITEYYYFDGFTGKWKQFNGDGIYSVFEQTADGFKMRGNVEIDGSLVVGLAKVAETLYLGDIQDADTEKRIYFTGGALIIGKNQDLTISALNTYFGGGFVFINSDSYFNGIVDFSDAAITWGANNQPVCVFGIDE